MKNRRVFYHVGGRIGKFPQMDEPKDSLGSGFDEVSPVYAPSDISAEPPPPFAPMKLSPFEAAMQKVFIGQNGLRAIWRLLIYLIMFRGLRFCLFVLLAYGLPDLSFLWRQTAAEFGLAIIAIVPALLMAKIEGRSFGSYGLPFRNAFGRLFWVGAAWGLVSLTILLVALRGAHAFYFGTIALHGLRVLKFAVFWAGFFLIVGFYEEFFTRGYTQFTLTDGVGFWPAAVLLSLGFGALHLENPGEDWVG